MPRIDAASRWQAMPMSDTPSDDGPDYWVGKTILAPYLATPTRVVDRMLRLAGVAAFDTVYDLGCGDGRIVIAAARDFGARGVGVDVEPYRIEESRANALAAGVADRVRFERIDALQVDISPATVVALYLVDWSTPRVIARIAAMCRPGTRIVSHSFALSPWAPQASEEVVDEHGNVRRIHLWIVPERSEEAHGGA